MTTTTIDTPTDQKRCSTCKHPRALTDFHKNGRSPSGAPRLHARCRFCMDAKKAGDPFPMPPPDWEPPPAPKPEIPVGPARWCVALGCRHSNSMVRIGVRLRPPKSGVARVATIQCPRCKDEHSFSVQARPRRENADGELEPVDIEVDHLP